MPRKQDVRLLTLAEKRTLYQALVDAKESGDYYGQKELYYARLERLLKWVEDLPFRFT